eukprot:CAMPEP_0196174328 /NCGR_PEP_ID=MMETSP0911-20130528/7356_1 /TAXON_ID=49265 /ORGANISM="Thalassiosira rotula, Strain GSO102" /LENGTH=146 /DNA_ID=CAMNT_0041441689 /DNA_START=594 /DNA_END=1034 /DNA_ORIENTATION=+
MTACPSQSTTFLLFLIDTKTCMGIQSEANKPVCIRTVITLLKMIKEEAMAKEGDEAKELWKVGAAIAVAQMGSLRGPEVFMLDLAGIRAHIEKDRQGVMPDSPLDDGEDLFGVTHVYLAMIDQFKGETGVREHLIAVPSESRQELT